MQKTALVISLVALSARAALSTLQVLQGIQWIPWLYWLPMWTDFYVYYVNQLSSVARGLIPYRDFAYSYTPLFIYSLYPFYALGGSHLASVPIIVSDALTAVLIYLIVRKQAPNKVAAIAGLGYALLPFALIYEGYLWLSSQPMTLLILLSIYFAKESRQLYSGLFLALAIMFKQEALFVLPAYLFWYAHKAKVRIWKTIVCLCGTLFAISLPFIILSGEAYLNSISYGVSGHVLRGISSKSTLANVTSISSTSINCESITLTLLGTHTGCSYSFVIYPNPMISFILMFLDQLSIWTLIPILILSGIALYASRNKWYFAELASAYSILIFLSLFSYWINSMHRYYLIPVYSLLLASSQNKKGLAVGLILPTLSLITTAGSFQILLPAFGIILMLAQEGSLNTSSSSGRSLHPVRISSFASFRDELRDVLNLRYCAFHNYPNIKDDLPFLSESPPRTSQTSFISAA